MKQTRRKELKTNDLSIRLQQFSDSIQRNATYWLGVIVIVVAILVIALYVQHRRHKTMAEAWSAYYEVREMNVVTKPEALDRARELADKYGDNAQLGPAVLQLKGDMACEAALALVKPEEQTRRIELLENAKASFEQLLQQYGSDPQIEARAHMSLAKVGETLLALNKGKIEEVRGHYQALVEKKPNPFVEISEKRLGELTKKLEPLNIVATRPAEPPASAPAAANATTKPAAVIATPVTPIPAAPVVVPVTPTTAPAATSPK